MLQAYCSECNVRRRKNGSKSPIREARMKRTLKDYSRELRHPVSINKSRPPSRRLRLISAITLVPGLKRLGREVRLRNQPVIGVSSKSNPASEAGKDAEWGRLDLPQRILQTSGSDLLPRFNHIH